MTTPRDEARSGRNGNRRAGPSLPLPAGTGRRWLRTAALVVAAALCLSPVTEPASAQRAAGPVVPGARAPNATTPAPRGWLWPLLPRPAVVRPFDAPEHRWSAGHRGVDLAAAPGARVVAPAAGTVEFVGVVVDRQVLTIAHAGGLRSSFEPVTTSLHRGQAVAAGQEIGRLAGRSHCAPGSCVHWGVRLGQEYVDPLSLILDRRPSVLLPLEAR